MDIESKLLFSLSNFEDQHGYSKTLDEYKSERFEEFWKNREADQKMANYSSTFALFAFCPKQYHVTLEGKGFP